MVGDKHDSHGLADPRVSRHGGATLARTIEAMSVYNQHQAAAVCGVSVRTLQRRLPALESAGAWKDASGQWHITLDALRAAGMAPGRPAGPPAPHTTADDTPRRQHDTTGALARQQAELDQANRDIAEWRRRAELAEALAAERARTIDAQALALRALTTHQPDPAPARTPAPPAPAPPPHQHPAPRTLWTLLRHLNPLPA